MTIYTNTKPVTFNARSASTVWKNLFLGALIALFAIVGMASVFVSTASAQENASAEVPCSFVGHTHLDASDADCLEPWLALEIIVTWNCTAGEDVWTLQIGNDSVDEVASGELVPEQFETANYQINNLFGQTHNFVFNPLEYTEVYDVSDVILTDVISVEAEWAPYIGPEGVADALVLAMGASDRVEALAIAQSLERSCVPARPVCDLNPGLFADDPLCVPCPHDDSLLDQTQECLDLTPCALNGLGHLLASDPLCEEFVLDVIGTYKIKCGAHHKTFVTFDNQSSVDVEVEVLIDGERRTTLNLGSGANWKKSVMIGNNITEDGTHVISYIVRYTTNEGVDVEQSEIELVTFQPPETDCFPNVCEFDDSLLAEDPACVEVAVHNPMVEVVIQPCNATYAGNNNNNIMFINDGTVDQMTVEVTVNGFVMDSFELNPQGFQTFNVDPYIVEDAQLNVAYSITINGEEVMAQTVINELVDCEEPVNADWIVDTSLVCGGTDNFVVTNTGDSALTLNLSVEGEIQEVSVAPGATFSLDLAPYLVEDVTPTAYVAYRIEAGDEATDWTQIDLGTARNCLPIVPEGDENGVEIQRVMPCGADTVELINNSDEFTAVITDITDGIVTIQIDDVDDLDLDGTTFDFFTLVYSGGDCEETIEEEVVVEVEDNDKPCVHNEDIASTDENCVERTADFSVIVDVECGSSESITFANNGTNSPLTVVLFIDGEPTNYTVAEGAVLPIDLSSYLVEDEAVTTSVSYQLFAPSTENGIEGITQTQFVSVDLGSERDCIAPPCEFDESILSTDEACVEPACEFDSSLVASDKACVEPACEFDSSLVASDKDCVEETLITDENEEDTTPEPEEENEESEEDTPEEDVTPEPEEDATPEPEEENTDEEEVIEEINTTDGAEEEAPVEEEDESELALTGGFHKQMMAYAGVLLATGFLLFLIGRRKREDDIVLWSHSGSIRVN